MKIRLLILAILLSLCSRAQVKVSGTVVGSSGKPVAGANVFIQGSYDGCTTDSLGQFQFKTRLTGQQILVASFVGFEAQNIKLNIRADNLTLKISLSETENELNEVVINAGTFEASDQKKAVILKPMDVALTAGANGDIFNAFSTLPGSEKVGEEGRLFVRGGEANETKTFMDGLLVSTPYYSKMPDLPTRGRFSPLLFNGSVFSTGGYSAEYGQALSSIVALNTVALEPKNSASFSLLTVGTQGSYAQRWNNTSLAFTGELLHSGLTDKLFRQNVDWMKDPFNTGSTIMFRHKTGRTGMIKAFGSFNYNTSSLRYNNFQESLLQDILLKNNNVYVNTTYNGMRGEKWMIYSGVAGNIDTENTSVNRDLILTTKKTGQVKVSLTNFTAKQLTTKMGAGLIFYDYRQKINMNGNYVLPFSNSLLFSFIESEVKIARLVALRAGVRSEYNSLIKNLKIMPRLSAAVKTGKSSQLSMAFGEFYQNPEDDYLKFTSSLSPEKATHSILTYQYKEGSHTLRIEAYYKKYSNLIKYKEEYSPERGNYTNNGSGYARGIDIFWRNQQQLGKNDYWITYSFIDSKRNYRDFPEAATPYFVSKHNLSVVYKRFFMNINSFVAATYSFASGRPYFNPNNPDFMADRTKDYNDVSIGLTHILYLFNTQTVVHLIVDNVFGFNNIYGYSYSNIPDSRGVYHSQPITPSFKQMAVGLISFQL